VSVFLTDVKPSEYACGLKWFASSFVETKFKRVTWSKVYAVPKNDLKFDRLKLFASVPSKLSP
jgi:hypothetical protein